MNAHSSLPSSSDAGQFRSLQILDELSNNDALTQRDLSNRLGIALGLVNSYLKNLIAKGYITVKNIPPKRYAYYLTPQGLAEKARLAYDLLADYNRIYREAKNNFRLLFRELEQRGIRRIVFAGADEVAEIAYITFQETGLELAGVVDPDKAGESFFGRAIIPIRDVSALLPAQMIITSYVQRQKIQRALEEQGITGETVSKIFQNEAT